jgi:hypothetical protein
MLGSVGGECKKFGHRRYPFGRLKKSGPQGFPQCSAAGLERRNEIDAGSAQFIGKDTQLRGLAAAVYAFESYEFPFQDGVLAMDFFS